MRQPDITPDGTRAYVTNFNSNSVWVIDTATNTVIGTIGVGSSPFGVAMTPDGTRAYVTNNGSASVSVLDTNPGAPLLNLPAGASITSTGTGTLLSVTSSTINAGSAIIKASGRSSVTFTEAAENAQLLVIGADQPIAHLGTIVGASAATVTAQKGLLLDRALLAATAPIFQLLAGSTMTTTTEALDLSYRAKVTSTGPIFKLDGSTMTVNNGAAVSVGGGSILRTSSDLFQLNNGATLRTLNGTLLNVAGGSVANITGGLINFGGTGGNTVNVTNRLCPCTTFSGIPVALTGGATSSNVSITNPIKNSSLGTITKSNPVTTSGGTALAVVNGSTSKLIIGGQ